jgi:uncharacterized protein
MFIAILQFQLLIDGAMGLKDKRRVVKSLKDRLAREHHVSVAEVGSQDTWNLATMGLVACGSSRKILDSQMAEIVRQIHENPGSRLASERVEIVPVDLLCSDPTDDDGNPLWTEDERRNP